MKFVVDVNLPPRLARWLKSQGDEAEHLADLDLLTATDTEIWDRGRNQEAIIVSKDNDFYDRALLFGGPATSASCRCWQLRQRAAFPYPRFRVDRHQSCSLIWIEVSLDNTTKN